VNELSPTEKVEEEEEEVGNIEQDIIDFCSKEERESEEIRL